MMPRRHLFIALVAARAAAAAAFPSTWIQLEPGVSLHDPATSSWAKLDKPPTEQSLTFTVAVRVDEERRAALEKVFWEVSDPDNIQYGNHLTLENVTELLAVPLERSNLVRNYFLDAGATSASVAPSRDMITVTMPVSAAEAALSTTFHVFGHNHHKTQIIRASAFYGLPRTVAEHVIMVGELLQFPNLYMKKLTGLVGGTGSWPNSCKAAACRGLVTPSVIAQRYQLPAATNVPDAANSMSVSEFQGQYYKDSDLKSFGASCGVNVAIAKNIGRNQQSAGVESELDIEYIKAVAPDVPLTVIYDDQYSLLNWANALNSMRDPPLVNSVSYGNDEAQQSSTEFMYTANTAFMKAGVRGLSVLFASGDQGVCGREGCGFFRTKFNPDFPAGSPYITSVGGTNFATNAIGDETAWNDGGGGFSDTFAIPEFQKAAVAAYKSNPDANLPPQAYWNNTGRGYPDIAALGGLKAPYCIATGGTFSGVAGTSAACPVAAGVFARLNGLRLAAGKKPMGFLNPFIYKNPSGFHDVTSGVNNAGGKAGFTAVKGWDAATGFGTPNYEALKTLAMGASASQIVV